MKQSRAKILLFLLLSAIAIPLTIVALQRFNIFNPNAAGATPELVIVSNLTDVTASISWTSGEAATLTNLHWGESTLLGNVESDLRDKRDKTTKLRTTHYVQLTGLQPNTTYYYRIISGETTYPAEDQPPATFKTLARSSATQPLSLTAYGDIETQEEDVVVIAYIPGKTAYAGIIPLSTVLNDDGTWLLNVASARNTDGTYVDPAENGEIALLTIGAQGKGSIKTYSIADSPLSLNATATLTQSGLDSILLSAPITTTPTPTNTPTTTTKPRQDVPLRPPGSTVTVTPTTSGTATPTPTTTIPQSNISKSQLLASFASPSVSNVTDSSLSIMFLTTTKIVGTLNWGASSTSLTSNRLDDRDTSAATARYIHHYTLTGLTANKQYFFKPTADPTTRTFTTPAKIATPSGQAIITGSLTNGSGECLVRTQIQRNSVYSSVITTLPNSLNSWAVNVMPVRTAALDTFMIPVATDTVLTNAFCFESNGDVYYQADATTVQQAVTSGISMTLVKLQ